MVPVLFILPMEKINFFYHPGDLIRVDPNLKCFSMPFSAAINGGRAIASRGQKIITVRQRDFREHKNPAPVSVFYHRIAFFERSKPGISQPDLNSLSSLRNSFWISSTGSFNRNGDTPHTGNRFWNIRGI